MAPYKRPSMADPNCKRCPDFVLPEFEDERLIFTVDGKIDEEAIKVLRALWVINHNRDIENWDHQHEAQAVEERLSSKLNNSTHICSRRRRKQRRRRRRNTKTNLC